MQIKYTKGPDGLITADICYRGQLLQQITSSNPVLIVRLATACSVRLVWEIKRGAK